MYARLGQRGELNNHNLAPTMADGGSLGSELFFQLLLQFAKYCFWYGVQGLKKSSRPRGDQHSQIHTEIEILRPWRPFYAADLGN